MAGAGAVRAVHTGPVWTRAWWSSVLVLLLASGSASAAPALRVIDRLDSSADGPGASRAFVDVPCLAVDPAGRAHVSIGARAVGAVAAVLVLAVGAAPAIGPGFGAAPAAAAAARGTQEAILQDDDHLVHASDAVVASTLEELAGLGVDRVRITLLWGATALPGGWAPYDRVVTLAGQRGIAVLLNLTGPAPPDAAGPGSGLRAGPVEDPSPATFGAWARQVGERYGGGFVPAPGAAPLPRVTRFSIWNEPNQAFWLQPQFVAGAERSPALYRALLDAAAEGLRASGHGVRELLIGELAPAGSKARTPTGIMKPLPFLRALYCVDERSRRLRGVAATGRGCPADGGPGFAREHPALFQAGGFAHHPYSGSLAPDVASIDPDLVRVADLPRLGRELDRAFAAHRVRRRMPVWLTEGGWQTRPPDPQLGVAPRLQARWIAETERTLGDDPRIRSSAQFLLVDDEPWSIFGADDPRRWGTFQSGLRFVDGRAKPAYASYRLPLLLEPSSRGRTRIWGLVRPGRNGVRTTVAVEHRPAGAGRWRAVARRRTRTWRGDVRTVLRLRAGTVRLVWRSPSGGVVRSPAVRVPNGD